MADGIITSAYAKGGWKATLTGTVTSARKDNTTLTITHGTTKLTIPGVNSIAWTP